MKNIFIVFITTLFSFNTLLAQCPTGDVDLTTQAEVDQFLVDYPNCTTLNGKLTIGFAEGGMVTAISDLSPLSNLFYVNNDIIVRNNLNLSSLNGLHKLLTIGGMQIVNNSSLVSLIGISSIHEMNGDLIISENNSLVS